MPISINLDGSFLDILKEFNSLLNLIEEDKIF